jgi:hypothetical protein
MKTRSSVCIARSDTFGSARGDSGLQTAEVIGKNTFMLFRNHRPEREQTDDPSVLIDAKLDSD